MAFVTGSVASLADLRQALIDGCTANGWTLTGTVLSKGTCYVNLPATTADWMQVQGGTGIDGSNALTGAGPRAAGIFNTGLMPLTWPATYRLHVMGDEVYLILNYSVEFYQWVAFGQSPVAGLPGTGNWYAGTYSGPSGTSQAYAYPAISPTSGGGINGGNRGSCALFWQDSARVGSAGFGVNSFVHHGLAAVSGGWSGLWGIYVTATAVDSADAIVAANPLIDRQPGASAAESILVPIRPIVGVGESKVSFVAQLRAARYLRIDNYQPQDIITLGSDRWSVYPWLRRDVSRRDGPGSATGFTHTGTLGWAIKYDGP